MKIPVINKAIDKYKRLAIKQGEKGIATYGQTLDALDNKHDWLQMAAEEQVDGFQYLEAERLKREFVVEKIERILVNNTKTPRDPMAIEAEIGHWLDVLQGDK